MLEFPLGVACGANKFLYSTPTNKFHVHFAFGSPAEANKLKHVGPNTMEIFKTYKNKCTREAPNKHLRKLELCGAESQICATANSKNA